MTRGLTLVLGGARSGKSAFAEGLVSGLSRVLYVATAQAVDPEMEERIALHRARRPGSWSTLEVEGNLADALAAHLGDSHSGSDDARGLGAEGAGKGTNGAHHAAVGKSTGCEAILLDSLDLYVSSQDLLEDPGRALAEVDDFLALTRELDLPVAVVSCEVGMGVVPPFPSGRAFRDLLGLANQRVAAQADTVFLVVAGQALAIKQQGAPQGIAALMGPIAGPRTGGGLG